MAIAHRAVGTWATLTADAAVTIPAGTQDGDRLYLFAAWKAFSITASVAGWTEVTEFADGAVANGNGVGSVKVGCWYFDRGASAPSNPTLDFSASPDVAGAVIIAASKGAGEAWKVPAFVTAAITNWTTTSQIVSASSSVAVPSGAIVYGLAGIRDDSATFTRPTSGIDAASGVTWNGNYVEAPAAHLSTVTGFDLAVDLGYRLVTTGGAGITLRQTATLSAAETGAALWIVQEVGPPDVNLQADANGSSSGDASISQEIPLAAGADGSSSGVAALELSIDLAALADGSSSGVAILSAEIFADLFGTADGSSSGTASLEQEIPLSALADGASSGVASLEQAIGLQAAADGASSGLAALSLDIDLAAASDGSSAGVAALEVDAPETELDAFADGSSTAVASLDVALELGAGADGSSSGTAALELGLELSATAGGTSSAVASLEIEGGEELELAGSATGSSAAEALLLVEISLFATADGSSSAIVRSTPRLGTIEAGVPTGIEIEGGTVRTFGTVVSRAEGPEISSHAERG